MIQFSKIVITLSLLVGAFSLNVQAHSEDTFEVICGRAFHPTSKDNGPLIKDQLQAAAERSGKLIKDVSAPSMSTRYFTYACVRATFTSREGAQLMDTFDVVCGETNPQERRKFYPFLNGAIQEVAKRSGKSIKKISTPAMNQSIETHACVTVTFTTTNDSNRSSHVDLESSLNQ